MKTRRDFLKQGAGLSAGMLTASYLMGAAHKMKSAQLGIQIYSVRNQLKEDFHGTLKQIAKIGYKNIEAYGLGADGKYLGKVKAADYKKMCDDLGMKLVSTHGGYCDVDQAQAYIDGAHESGLEYLIVPWLPEELRQSADDYKRIAETLNKVGEVVTAAGLKFGYHNHSFEFEKKDGQVPMEILLKGTDPKNVTFEADLYWITKGGYDPIKFMGKFPGRFSCFHIKDADKDLEGATVGKGIIDFAAIFASNSKHLRYYFVEDERTDSPLKNIRAAYRYLSKADFV